MQKKREQQASRRITGVNDAAEADIQSLCGEKRDLEVKAVTAGRDEKGRVKTRRGGGGVSE